MSRVICKHIILDYKKKKNLKKSQIEKWNGKIQSILFLALSIVELGLFKLHFAVHNISKILSEGHDDIYF